MGFVLLSQLALAIGCGAAAPPEAAIYHDPALRPGVVAAVEADETELLSRLASDDSTQTIIVGDRRFEVAASYHAASGRPCRSILTDRGAPRLACRADDEWVFVPQVVPTSELEALP